MSWKQPIDTGYYQFFDEDYAAMNVLIHLLLHARDEDMDDFQLYKGKPFKLKRGQAIYGRNQYAKYTCLPPSSVDRALVRLEKLYSKVTSERSMNFSTVTILNYDEEIRMDKHLNKQRTSSKQAADTNKIVRSIISKEIIHIVSEFGFSIELKEAVIKYLEDMQKRGGAFKKTPEAVKLLCKKLEAALKKEFVETDLIENIDVAITKGWKDIYPKKAEEKEVKKASIDKYKIELYASDTVNKIARELGKRPNGYFKSANSFVESFFLENSKLPPPRELQNYVRSQMKAKSTAPP